jgi:DNA-binding response OmpR family regulator
MAFESAILFPAAEIMKQPCILIVEDDPNICDLIKLTLGNSDCRLFSAAGGNEALQKISVEKPDLIVLDILMPAPDGWDVYAAVRRNPELASTRVIILTALPVKPEVLVQKNLLPQDRFMGKPFDLEDLRSTVRALLEQCSRTINQVVP